jgi:hypothetical protein
VDVKDALQAMVDQSKLTATMEFNTETVRYNK